MIPRGGGGELLAASAASHIQVAAQMSSFLGVVNGIMYLFWTERIEKMYGGQITEPQSPSRFAHQAMGSVVLGQGLSLYLLLVCQLSPLISIGSALLPRLLYSYYCVVVGQKLSNATPFLKTNTLLMTWVCISVLTGLGNPTVASRVFSTMALFKGGYLAFSPVAASNKFFGVDVSDNTSDRLAFQAFGEHLLYTAIYMATLAYGVAPTKAAGWAAICALFVYMILQFGLDRGDSEIRLVKHAYLVGSFVLCLVLLWP
jgi:hypothetical protein